MTNIFKAIKFYTLATKLEDEQSIDINWLGMLPIHCTRNGSEVTYTITPEKTISVHLDRDGEDIVTANDNGETHNLVYVADTAEFLYKIVEPVISATFAKAGYNHIAIHNDGKLVRIYDAETCEYYATANYENGGYTIWPNDVDFPDPIGRVELN